MSGSGQAPFPGAVSARADYWDTSAPRDKGVTAEAVDAEARRIIDSGQLVWVVVADAATMRPQLKALGLPVEVRAAP